MLKLYYLIVPIILFGCKLEKKQPIIVKLKN